MSKKNKKVICYYCAGNGKLESSLKVYEKDYGMLWICENYPSCDAYVGCHEGTTSPKGWMANEELRAWRKETHRLFDALWREKIRVLHRKNGFNPKHKKQARTAAYHWLANQLEIETKYCHVGMFDVEMCQLAIAACEPFYEKILWRKR